MMRRAMTAVLVTFLLVTPVASAAGVSQTHDAVAGTELKPDDVFLEVNLAADGSATWTVEYRVRLDDENVTAAFESVRSDVRENESSFARPFADRMRATAAEAENATGRQMSIANVSVTAERRQIPQDYGVIAYHFRWNGFARANETTVVAGDALSGFFLDNQTTLLVSWPESHELARVSPKPSETRDRAVVWTGPTNFATGEPRVVASTQAGGATTTGTPGGRSGGGLPPVVYGLVAVAVVAAGAVLFVYRRGGLGDEEPPGGDASAGEQSGGGGTGAAGTAGATEPQDQQEPPEELLSNEERVLRLVRRRGGRIKQQEVAQALDWTDAKTSQVVRKMRDEGQLEGFRLGRENVLSLPDYEEGDDEDAGGDGGGGDE